MVYDVRFNAGFPCIMSFHNSQSGGWSESCNLVDTVRWSIIYRHEVFSYRQYVVVNECLIFYKVYCYDNYSCHKFSSRNNHLFQQILFVGLYVLIWKFTLFSTKLHVFANSSLILVFTSWSLWSLCTSIKYYVVNLQHAGIWFVGTTLALGRVWIIWS